MASEYLDLAGASRFKSNIDTLLNEKQDNLVSGTNIKTINNQSLLGSGNIDVSGGGNGTFIAVKDVTTYTELKTAIEASRMIFFKAETSTNIIYIPTYIYVSTAKISMQFATQSTDYGLIMVAAVTNTNSWAFSTQKQLQPKLVSGTNVKTINNQSILGSGNLDIQGGSGTIDTAMSDSSENAVQNKVIKSYVDTGLSSKQDTLVSGTNIKTVNNESLLGSGNIDITGGDVDTAMSDSSENAVQNKVIKSYVDTGLATKANTTDLPVQATDSTLGIVKTNSAESVTLNADGQLDIGGRLGAFSGTTGIYHSKDRAPRRVGDYSFLITDAKGMNLDAPRNFVLATGVNLTLTKSHAAGSTTYTVANNYANRIACAVLANGGYVSQSEAYSKENQIVQVTSVKINGSNFTPDSSPNDTTKPITITTVTSANPTSAVTALRVFGGVTGGFCSEYIGQCVGGTVGASLVIGQRVYSSSNVNCIVAADVYNTGNGNAIFGRQHISRKNRGLLAGTGHDTTNARSESVSAVGEWSDITSETLFAVGDGADHTNRSNAFEVQDDGIVLKSPNGTRYKVSVDNSGNLSATAI